MTKKARYVVEFEIEGYRFRSQPVTRDAARWLLPCLGQFDARRRKLGSRAKAKAAGQGERK